MTIWAIALLLFSAGTGPEARVERLERSLLAPCCYKESIWRHHSDISTKMKLEVAGWVAAGKSDEEILAVYRERYGARVVTAPEPDPSPWVQIVPWLAALGGAMLVVWLLARWRSEGAEAAELPLS